MMGTMGTLATRNRCTTNRIYLKLNEEHGNIEGIHIYIYIVIHNGG